MERRSVYKSFQIVGILFFILFFTSISVLTLQAQTTQKEEEIDITALSRKIEQLDERDYPDFASIFQKLVSMRTRNRTVDDGSSIAGDFLIKDIHRGTGRNSFVCFCIFEYFIRISVLWRIRQWIFNFLFSCLFDNFYKFYSYDSDV